MGWHTCVHCNLRSVLVDKSGKWFARIISLYRRKSGVLQCIGNRSGGQIVFLPRSGFVQQKNQPDKLVILRFMAAAPP